VPAGRHGVRLLRATAAANHLAGRLPSHHRGVMGGRSGGSDRPGSLFSDELLLQKSESFTPNPNIDLIDRTKESQCTIEF